MSNAAVVQALGAQFRTYRIRARLTQQEVAQRAGVSVLTVRSFELGRAVNITIGNFLSLLRAIDQLSVVADVLPEVPISPYLLSELGKKQPKRVRHGK